MGIFPLSAQAIGLSEFQEKSFKLRVNNQIFDLKLVDRSDWIKKYPKYYWHGIEIKVASELEVNSFFNELIEIKYQEGLDQAEIKKYLDIEVVPKVTVTKRDVRIYRDENDNIIFDGAGRDGVDLDVLGSVSLIKQAISNHNDLTIKLPIMKTKALITVDDPELKKLGLKDVVAIGESNFYGSTWSRIHNIDTGSSKINGAIVESGAIFSTAQTIGAVNAQTGYKQELVIKGPKTIPEYGGGLCQVSSTMYRAALDGGFPVTQRQNHSYSVSYYKPWGIDAAIYPPTVDLKFKNNTGHPLLIQKIIDKDNRYLAFHIYGTADGRETELFGPYLSNWRAPPAPRVETLAELAPGQKKVYEQARKGFDSTWIREITSGTGYIISETIYSRYMARPLYYAIGKEILLPENKVEVVEEI